MNENMKSTVMYMDVVPVAVYCLRVEVPAIFIMISVVDSIEIHAFSHYLLIVF